MSNFIKKLKNVFFPDVKCIACGRELCEDSALGICTQCFSELRVNNGNTCNKCGRALISQGNICLTCRKTEYDFDRAYSAYVYEGRVKELILRFKYHDMKQLAAFFAVGMYETFLKSGARADCIAFVPMTRARLFARGYNQAKLLALAFSELSGLPVIAKLTKTKSTRRQALLGARERRANLEGCFTSTDRTCFQRKHVLLIDDVLTTGTTAAAVAHALKNAGAETVIVLTACTTYEILP